MARMKTPHSTAGPAEDLYLRIRETVARHLPNARYRLFLFGSRSQGMETDRSDYDLGILADRILPLSTMARIREDLEAIPILQRIDLVDLSAADPTFVKNALKTSRLLDERG